MKLRNKKTGEIGQIGYVATQDGQIIVEDISGEEYPYSIISSYDNLAELNEEWEDVEGINVTNIPLIKDEKIRKAVRAWAEANGIERVWHEYSSCWLRGNGLSIEMENEVDELEQGNYSIAELCGEEE